MEQVFQNETFTDIVLDYIKLSNNKSLRISLYDSCKSDSWLETTRKLKAVFTEYCSQVDEPVYIRRLLVKALKEVDWLAVAIRMYRCEEGKRLWSSLSSF